MDFSVFQLVPIVFCPISAWKKRDLLHLFLPSHQLFMHFDKISSQAFIFLWIRSPGFLTLFSLQALHHLCSLSLNSICPCLSCTVGPSTGHRARCVSAVLSREERLLPFTCCQSSAECRHRCCWSSLPYFCLMAHLLLTRISSTFPDILLFSQPALHLCTGIFFLGVGLSTSFSWASWASCQPVSSACWGSSEWQHNHLVYPQFLPLL